MPCEAAGDASDRGSRVHVEAHYGRALNANLVYRISKSSRTTRKLFFVEKSTVSDAVLLGDTWEEKAAVTWTTSDGDTQEVLSLRQHSEEDKSTATSGSDSGTGGTGAENGGGGGLHADKGMKGG